MKILNLPRGRVPRAIESPSLLKRHAPLGETMSVPGLKACTKDVLGALHALRIFVIVSFTSSCRSVTCAWPIAFVHNAAAAGSAAGPAAYAWKRLRSKLLTTHYHLIHSMCTNQREVLHCWGCMLRSEQEYIIATSTAAVSPEAFKNYISILQA